MLATRLDAVGFHGALDLVLLSSFGKEAVAWGEDFLNCFSVDSEGGFEGDFISGEFVEFERDRLE